MQTCAVCKAALEGKATRQGPFCGPRCRTIDLGKWLGGDYVVSRPLGPEDAEGDLEGMLAELHAREGELS